MRMKKCFTVILSFLLALSMPGALGVSGALAAEAGETVTVEFAVLEDTGAVYAAKLELHYDHEALELVPNRSFESDKKVYIYGVPLQAVFRIRENAAPGNYPVTLKILDASGPMGEAVLSPETALVFSEESVAVELPPVEVPVYYMSADDGKVVVTESTTLAAGQTSMVNAKAPAGWVVVGGESIPVNVTADGRAIPSSVIFWLVTPAPSPAKTPTPKPVTPGPTPLPEISVEITRIVGSNWLRWDRVPGAERYRVYRGTSGNGNYDLLATVTVLSYSDSAVKGGTTYYYMVEALFPNGQTVAAAKSAVAATPTPSPTSKPTPKPSPTPKPVPTSVPTKGPIRVGGYVTFGNYEQDNDTGNGKEPIEWLVLEMRGGKALLISRYALDCKPYNTGYADVTWETCSLRAWLNGEFMKSAFSAKERQAIKQTTVNNSARQGYSGWYTNGGNNTQDRIFLLSYAEAWKYFSSDSERQCEPTEYAVARGAYKAGNGKCWWWLRSPGSSSSSACYVSTDGTRHYFSVYFDNDAVRPALWVDLDSGFF